MAARGDLIAQFIEITGTDENVARFYLSSCDWDIEVSFRPTGDNNDAAKAQSSKAFNNCANYTASARAGQLLEHPGGPAGSGADGGPRGQPQTKADIEQRSKCIGIRCWGHQECGLSRRYLVSFGGHRPGSDQGQAKVSDKSCKVRDK